MCGIAGAWGAKSNILVEQMSAKLEHRGPDGQGLWHQAPVALGHRRLAINDLGPDGHQPMIALDGNVVITVNGEIYNYRELRSELELRGAFFKGHCDSEVVLHAWKYWGDKCFSRFNGMFAIGLFDVVKNQLVIARDRLGIKPVYYSVQDGTFFFASEIKALKMAASRAFKLDKIGLAQYLSIGNYLGSQSLYQDVKLLEPGAFVVYDGDRLVQRQFWTIEESIPDKSIGFDESIQQYGSRFRDAIGSHLMSDVPIAAYLSSGIDSATVAAQVAESATPPACFTGTFSDGGWYDESTFASKLAKGFGSEHTKVVIRSDDVPIYLDTLISALDEPRMGMGAFSQFCVAQAVGKSHKVVLTGHGGDELFSGYPIFKFLNLLTLTNQPVAFIKALGQFTTNETPHAVYFLLAMLLRKKGANLEFPVLMTERKQIQALRKEWFEPLVGSYAKMPSDRPRATMLAYLTTYLNGLLVVEDKISMHHSIESRTPLLDNDLVNLALNIPQALKVTNGELKAIPRQYSKRILPAEILSQPKRGFPTPFRFWLRNDLRDWVQERLSGEGSALRILFKQDWLTKNVEGYLNSKTALIRPLDEIPTQRMFALLSLESWLRQNPEVV